MATDTRQDGIHALPPRESMAAGARKLREAYAITPGAPLFRKEFGFYCLERWKEQGLPQDVPLAELFHYDPPGQHDLWGAGWCEAAFSPLFEDKVVEDRGDHEVIQDAAGRRLLCFKGRRQGFMPAYLGHPVKDWKTWEEQVKWRLDPAAPGRLAGLEAGLGPARAAARQGMMMTQRVVGGYMYLRSLIGPAEVAYAFYDQPDLIHDCMKTWLALADAVIARHQQELTIDELFFGEDICYKSGPLISPDMIRRFLFPYYQHLIANLKRRQLDPGRHLFFHVDTDGFAPSVIPLYRELGLDAMCPFEVAAGCDVVEIGRRCSELVIAGGIDKRVLATTKDEIDRCLERVLPPMRARGGYIPTCDHGVPEEVSLDNYLHYRKRCIELGG
jgi:uroporphyrinogen decarboxylase